MNASDLRVAYTALNHLTKTKALPEGAIQILRTAVAVAHGIDQARDIPDADGKAPQSEEA